MLKKEQTELVNNAWRILRCMREFFLHIRSPEGILNSIRLATGLEQSLWPDGSLVLYQLPKIGQKLAQSLAEVRPPHYYLKNERVEHDCHLRPSAGPRSSRD